MINDRLNLWLPLIPETDCILLCRPPKRLTEGLKKANLNFDISSGIQGIKEGKKYKTICLWATGNDEEWLYQIGDSLDTDGTLVILPFKKNEKKIEEILIEMGMCRIDRYFLLPNSNDPRWMIPDSSTKVISKTLDLYQPYKWKARLGKLFTIVGFKSTIIRELWNWERVWIALRNPDAIPNIKSELSKHFNEEDIFLSISSGTLSPHRKITMQVMDAQGTILGLVKIGMTEVAKKQIEREAHILNDIKSLNLRAVIVPNVLEEWNRNDFKYLLMSSCGEKFTSGPIKIGSTHRDFLKEIYQKTLEYYTFEAHPAWVNLARNIKKIDWEGLGEYESVLKNSLNHIKTTFENERVPAIRVHGDFAPWNTKVFGNLLFLFDWEYSESSGIPFYDLIHWHFQTMSLVKRNHPSRIADQLEREIRKLNYDELTTTDLHRKAFISWYFTDSIVKRILRHEADQDYLNKLLSVCSFLQESFNNKKI